MQSVSSRIWTRIAVSISYDDNHYTTGTSFDNHYTTGTSFYVFINTYLSYFILEKGWSFYGMKETDGWTEGDKDRLLYWPITSPLDQPCCVILKAP